MRSALLLLVPALLAGCSQDRRRRPDPVEPTLESIAVSPPSAMLDRGDTLAMIASGTYSDGTTKDISATATWSSSDTTVATVENGVVTALAGGTAKIEATLDGKTGSSTLIVATAEIVTLTLEPTTASVDVGATVQIRAVARFADMSSADVTGAMTWTSSGEAIATVSGGLVTGIAPGSVSISARDPASGTTALEPAIVTVSGRAPVSLTVGPSMIQLPIGGTQQFTATASYEDGSSADITSSVMWSSTRVDIATADPSGLATAVADGITSITAIEPGSGVQASVTLRVVPAAIIELTVTPTAAVVGMGGRITFSAEASYTDGATRDLTSAVVWSSSDTNVATVSNTPGMQGTITTIGPGTAIISALEPQSGVSTEDTQTSATLTVTAAVLESIIVLPAQTTIPFGATQQYRALGLYSDNSSQDLSAQVTWQSSNTGVATIDGSGLATSVAQGMTTISALDPVTGIGSDDANQSAALTVDPPAIVSIAVTPATRAMIVGGTQQFTATGLFSDGSMQVITQSVSWDGSSPAITIDPSGLATAQQQGTAVISALDVASGISSDASNQSAVVTVSIANLVSIAVTPTSTTVPIGADVQLIATGTYDNGATQDITEVVTWASSNQTVARVSNTAGSRGVATALANGTTTISATEPSSGISSNGAGGQSASMTVQTIALSSIAVSPQGASVDVGGTLPFTAIGTYANGARFNVTSAVTWSSSNNNLATISNLEGTRGVATGVAVGSVTITALFAASGVSGSASLTVELGIVTISRTWGGPTVELDGTADYSVNVGMVSFTAADFPANALISDVDITINFLKTDGTCAAPASGSAYHDETNFRMQSGTGAQVILATPNTWSGFVAIQPVTVTFDQSAAAVPSNTPVSGSFLPNGGNLDTFDGQSPIGTWILQAGDNAFADPLCVSSYTVTITAQ